MPHHVCLPSLYRIAPRAVAAVHRTSCGITPEGHCARLEWWGLGAERHEVGAAAGLRNLGAIGVAPR